ncbi:MAG TPA: endolytic transglycosylase MltG [Anaerolineales bacterium]|nr:endolytic transglycosylase MltG [Anaerolineales bacterium]
MSGGRRRSVRGLLLFFLLVACLGCAAVVVLSVGVQQAALGLGPAAPGLDPVQKTLLSYYLVANEPLLNGPAGDSTVSYDFVVTPGETAGDVAARLQEADIARNPALLRAYLRYRGLDVGIKAGSYLLRGSMSVPELADALQAALPEGSGLTIPEGWRAEQIAALLPAEGLAFSPAEFLSAARSRPDGLSFSGELPNGLSLEGFLFPDTYNLSPTTTASEFVRLMLEDFDRRVSSEMRQGFASQGLSLYQAVTLASIVEREAVVADERPLIASVFLNRLSAGMNLDADPTVQYALGRQPGGTWWKAVLSVEDLEFDSPYNTYVYPGLPPGPISNPGLDALRSVAFPAQTNYLYFRAMCDGSGLHAFATTFEEHLQNACP